MAKTTGNPDKWPTPEDRKAACKSFCDHISQGYSMKSWPEAHDDTVRTYMDRYPEDFDKEMIERAQRESLLFWEKIGIAGTVGKIPFFNSGSWIFNMKNRAGWRDKVEHDHGGKVELVTIVDDVPPDA